MELGRPRTVLILFVKKHMVSQGDPEYIYICIYMYIYIYLYLLLFTVNVSIYLYSIFMHFAFLGESWDMDNEFIYMIPFIRMGIQRQKL